MKNEEIISEIDTISVKINPEVESNRTIDPELAQSYVDNWKNGQYQIVPDTVKPSLGQIQLNSFSFSIEDFKLLSTLAEKYNEKNPSEKIEHVNCRIGLKPDPKNEGNFIPYMFFEPLLGNKPGKRLPYVPYDDEYIQDSVSACYDVCYPCPPTCPAK
jgi:hypothetical protein